MCLTALVGMLGGCALPGDRQDGAPCLALEEAWNGFSADRPSTLTPLTDALEGFDYSTSTSTAADAAVAARHHLVDTAAGDLQRYTFLRNALDIIVDECSEAAGITLDGDGDLLPDR